MKSISRRLAQVSLSKYLTRHYAQQAQVRHNAMRRDLSGRVAIVTAGTMGLGLNIARRLGEDGAHVVVSSRQQKNVDKATDELKSLGIDASGMVCHVGNADERTELLRKTAAEFGGIDILVSNAGVNPHTGPFFETPESKFDKVFDLHVKSNFCLVRDVIPYMAKRGIQGSVLLTSSMAGYRSHNFPTAYSVSKSTLHSLMRAMMSELIHHNIRINCLGIGLFDTEFSNVLRTGENEKKFMAMIPMKRFGKPEEIGGIAAFLCSDDASYITGETYIVGGGSYSRL